MTNPIAKLVHCPTCGAPPRNVLPGIEPAEQEAGRSRGRWRWEKRKPHSWAITSRSDARPAASAREALATSR
jgi:hypothetical protein